MGGDAVIGLDAYRRARLDEARAAARRVEAETEAASRARLEDATQAAEAILARARAEAAAEADRDGATAMARERRNARRLVLEAQRAAYEDMIERVRAGALALRSKPAYGQLLEGLERSARRRLGDVPVVVQESTPGGGIIAEADGRRLDYSLAALADRCAGELGAEVERLWR